ncbi:MAG: TRAP transporter small permease [Pseudomonadota bacterium]
MSDGLRPPAGRIARLPAALLKGVKLLLGGLMLLSIAINFANVLARYLFAEPFIWAEEAMIYIMIWLVFVGAILCTWDGKHLKMDLLTAAQHGWRRLTLNAVALGVLVFACGYVAWNSFPVVRLMIGNDQRSNAADIPMALPHSAVFIGFAAMLVILLVRFRHHLAGARRLEIDPVAEGGEPAASGPPDRES